MQLQEDAAPNVIWYAYMLCKTFSQQKMGSKNRTSTFLIERKGPALNPSQFVFETSNGAKGCKGIQADIWIHCLPLNSLPWPPFQGISPAFILSSSTSNMHLIDMLLQNCQGHICHLDSSRAVWTSSLLLATAESGHGNLWSWHFRRFNDDTGSFSKGFSTVSPRRRFAAGA